uniref:CHCH domain-containing protein n=1 Tax=Picea sitchensis TaxID=3332 RepID=A9NS75_PICSI|nr:unknown [Picea sitchensis]ABK26979.1 unknown [Picea sitchensis]
MPRRSSGGRPAPRAKPVSHPPQPAAHAPPPAPVQQGGGSMLGSIGSTIAEGVAFGTGSAIAHRAVDAFLGPRTVQHEVVQAEAPAAAQTSMPAMSNLSGKDSCGNHSKAFQECLTNYGSDIGKCQFYLDMLNECRRGSTTVPL